MDITKSDYEKFMSDNPKIKLLDPHDIPEELNISTMTMVCHVPVMFNIVLITKYLELSPDLIETIKCGNSSEIFRTISLHPNLKKKRKISKKQRKPRKTKVNNNNFYNQATIVINANNFITMNIKLFKNGAIQMTGCKKVSYVLWVLNKLFSRLKSPVPMPVGIETIDQLSQLSPLDRLEMHKRKYVEYDMFLDLHSVYRFRIVMINSDFGIGFNIDREKLFTLLHNENYECSLDPSRHPSVNLRYNNGNGFETSILTFEKGKVIITGAKNYKQLMECYKFINTYLISHYEQIVKKVFV